MTAQLFLYLFLFVFKINKIQPPMHNNYGKYKFINRQQIHTVKLRTHLPIKQFIDI